MCSAIPDVSRANTGREQVFPAPVRSLTRHELGRTEDLWECPACEAMFVWRDESSWTGSGNDDEEVPTSWCGPIPRTLDEDLGDVETLRELVARRGG